MTERLYYTDARQLHFSATAIAIESDGHHVVLDRTAFYPTSGGQPYDTGTLHGAMVTDVIDEDTRIVHVCASPVSCAVGDVIEGLVNAERRYHHMQQHSGQHLLSAILADGYGWPTVSVHFGDLLNTVDVAAAHIDPAQLSEIEQRVNRVAAEDRAITVSFEDSATASGLRKASDRAGILRIVSIDGIDRSACGGTHVSTTGEIGAVLLRRIEKTKGHTRIEFICGLRAVALSRTEATILSTVSQSLSAAVADVPAIIHAQQQRVTELERDRKRLSAELARYEAATYWQAAATDDSGVRRIRIPDVQGPVRDAEVLVQALTAMGPCVVLAVSPATGSVMLGAGEGGGVDAGTLLRTTLQSFGGRGGGSPRLAQGSIPDKLQLSEIAAALGFGV